MNEKDGQYDSETHLQGVKDLKLRIGGKPSWEQRDLTGWKSE